eukprot:TRINITY_DN25785_c0_g1_i1.p2 TRINITY_DN25785_c0_g1~~TRINITY_DN25785_c0_g1_i1.p2  ORF type:complete len:111 (-),score=8.56 TRINITY_DN25785_c0_g1_i1:133-444(-)
MACRTPSADYLSSGFGRRNRENVLEWDISELQRNRQKIQDDQLQMSERFEEFEKHKEGFQKRMDSLVSSIEANMRNRELELLQRKRNLHLETSKHDDPLRPTK